MPDLACRGQVNTTSSYKPTRGQAIVFEFSLKDVYFQLLEQKLSSGNTYTIPPAAALVLQHAQSYNVVQVSGAF